MFDKTQSRSLRTKIRRVLLDVWDPIGIKDEPNAQDEYDGYIGSIYDLVLKQATESEMIDYLLWAARDNMGLDATREDMRETASALCKIEISELLHD